MVAMSSNTPHVRLLNAASLDVLSPMGMWQRGRSRFWLDDHDWWLVLVEFQPSARSRGSYLNVGVMWLWPERDHLAFDVGYRLEDFVAFRNKAQFEREATRMVARAAEEVTAYRQQFVSVEAAADYLDHHCDGKNPWRIYHAGVACGLAGRATNACHRLDQLATQVTDDAGSALRQSARHLRPLAADRDAFRLAVEQIVGGTRELLRLPPALRLSFDRGG
jgi:hypothetical protein